MKTIIEQLRARRQERGQKQSELGAKLGLPQSHISKIEKELCDPRLSTVRDMARLLDQELVLVPRHMTHAVHALIYGEKEGERRFMPDDE